MKKITAFFLLLSLLSLAITACGGEENENNDTPPAEFEMTATVMELGEKILVNVTEAEYAEGPYLVIFSDATEILDKEGNKIKKADLAVGDEIKIWYSGQVMMSLPPQIVAAKITVL
jgi:hypothetical protein